MHPQTQELRSRYSPDGSDLRELQLKMLDILRIVTDICDRHGLTYWLSGGTLLGAVVHDGFIPWDDDIDIEMPRPDYKKLLKILPGELPEHLYLQTPKEKGYPILLSKVRDRNSIVYMKDEDTSKYKIKGFFIDIAPVERSYMWVKRILDNMYGRAFRRIKRGQPFRSGRQLFEFVTSLVLYPVSILLIGIARIICSITRPDSFVYSYGINANHCQKAGDLLPVSKIKFEGIEFAAPHHPAIYLYNQYRCDYTIIPPESGRPQHFIKIEYI
ncbi:lipopolysaccharide cholinephosphotransferase [Dysgonomonas hofstadii]|uniref:Lipopolysaccharide cholinephosphotransferase n=1 Tax=Dysgonomonas hofstadii TaxID=637886 RepID=A0A840D142_9BACT|nr:LicD family protein [Dysgonomonas hofstadii]MBB4038352.1 lipopolysaccharide cholinephosphotransferase [Dysgonomonas hofstadii]